ncbi:MAG: hypothetical protein V7637_2451, partial [Mycobacteriales bacterium]
MSTSIKIATGAAVGLLLFPVVLIAAAAGAVSSILGGGDGGGSSRPSTTAVADIPTDYLVGYQAAAPVCPGLSWTVLAGIGKIESDHGRSTLPGVHSGETRPAPAGHSRSSRPPGTGSSPGTASRPA